MNRYRTVKTTISGILLLIGASTMLSAQQAPASHVLPEALINRLQETATGKLIRPSAATGAIFQELNPNIAEAPNRRATYAVAVATSPDGRQLAILTSGFPAYFDKDGHILSDASKEFVFIFDITGNSPKQIQVLSIPNTFLGLTWSPSSKELFVSGGKDDSILDFQYEQSAFKLMRIIKLGHTNCLGAVKTGFCGPVVAGLAVSPDGRWLLAANIQNDSVTLIDASSGKIAAERDLRPGKINVKDKGKPGGSYPRAVVWTSSREAFVSSVRDREVISLQIEDGKVVVGRRLRVNGAPSALLANRSGSRVFVALDTTSRVAVLDARAKVEIEEFGAASPPGVFDNPIALGGANTNGLALLPNQRFLLVTNGGQNSLAVVRLSDRASDEQQSQRQAVQNDKESDRDVRQPSAVIGLVPTGWYPTGVAISRDGETWFVVNGKSPMGPNSYWCRENGDVYCDPKIEAHTGVLWFKDNGTGALLAKNAYVHQLEHAGFLTIPAPDGLELARLTQQVARNNRLAQPETEAEKNLFTFLHEHIKHVLYIVKQNRSYDQVLGDLKGANGDARLTLFPEAITPNHHAIAREFVTLDNFLVSGEVSAEGMNWTLAAQTSDLLERTVPVSVSTLWKDESGGFPYGSDRGALTGLATSAERHAFDPSATDDPDVLPGAYNVYDFDGPGGERGAGFIWDSARRAGLSVRSYMGGTVRFNRPDFHPSSESTPDLRSAGVHGVPQFPDYDLYWPNNWVPGYWTPDYWRLMEWKHEFDEFVANKNLPDLEVMHMWGDHLGNFNQAMNGVNTPETQMADNDYAVGAIIDAVAHSPYANDTLIITVEDDASDGPDHVDAQRSVALFAGPFVRRHAVVSQRCTTVNLVKTIEEILGMGPTNLNDALAAPMSSVFDMTASDWSYKATVPSVLRSTTLPLPKDPTADVTQPTHNAAYWAKLMGKNGRVYELDDINFDAFNRSLWRGLKGDAPYPAAATASGHKKSSGAANAARGHNE